MFCGLCMRGEELMESRFIGVADLASIRFSLPAHLLEPTPNLGMSDEELKESFAECF